MSPSPTADGFSEAGSSVAAMNAGPLGAKAALVKVARVFDEDDGGFGLEYDNTRGQKNAMRLDALTYEGAVREARSFLGIQPDDRDADGDRWEVE